MFPRRFSFYRSAANKTSEFMPGRGSIRLSEWGRGRDRFTVNREISADGSAIAHPRGSFHKGSRRYRRSFHAPALSPGRVPGILGPQMAQMNADKDDVREAFSKNRFCAICGHAFVSKAGVVFLARHGNATEFGGGTGALGPLRKKHPITLAHGVPGENRTRI